MPELPIMRVRYAANFTMALERLGARADPYLEQAHIDPAVLKSVDNFMPVSQLHRFVAAAVEDTGLTQLGIETGLSPRQRHSEFSRQVAVASTLANSLNTVCTNARSEDGSASFELFRRQSLVWLCCGRVDGPEEAVRAVETYRYGALLEIIRYATGPKWLPPKLAFQSAEASRLTNLPPFKGVDIVWESAELAIAIPARLLEHAIAPGQHLEKFMRRQPSRRLRKPISYREAMIEVIKTNMRVNRFRLADLAACLGAPTRTLQRSLAAHDLTFSGLLDEARTESAQLLLTESSLKLAEIAAQLGYRHSTHFSRAFKKNCGFAPRDYRREHHA